MYGEGLGVKQDYVEAVRWFKLAASQGDALAQNNLGVMYGKGQGAAQDYVEEVKWYKLAAAQGHAGAQFNLGNIYKNGNGVTQDYAEAIKWYKLAAAQGHADAQNNLGVMYGEGQGVAQVQTKLGVMDDGAWLKEWLNEELMLNLTKNLHDGRVEESKDGEISQQDEIIAKLAILSESKNIKTCSMTIQPINVNWSWDFSFSNEELESANKLVSALHDIRNGDFAVVVSNGVIKINRLGDIASKKGVSDLASKSSNDFEDDIPF
jgi:hypothetical protein